MVCVNELSGLLANFLSTSSPPVGSTDRSTTGIVVGAVVGAFVGALLLALLVIAVMIFTIMKHQKKQPEGSFCSCFINKHVSQSKAI